MIEFLAPVPKSVVAHREILPEGVLGKQIQIHAKAGELPPLKNTRFALLGIQEQRNDVNYIGGTPQFEAVRKSLYQLYPGNWSTSIVDLGNIEAGEAVQDTYFAVRTVVSALLKKNIIPLVLGGSQDLVFSLYRSYDEVGEMVNMVN